MCARPFVAGRTYLGPFIGLGCLQSEDMDDQHSNPPADKTDPDWRTEGLGWAGTAGADVIAATVHSALLSDRSRDAREFAEHHAAETSPAVRALIAEAFAVEATQGAEAAARVLAPLVYPAPPPGTSAPA
jgi:hypothetical protein